MLSSWKIHIFSLLLLAALADVEVIEDSSSTYQAPKIMILRGQQYLDKSPCELLYQVLQFEEVLKCEEETDTTTNAIGSVAKLTQTLLDIPIDRVDIRLNYIFQTQETVISGDYCTKAHFTHGPKYKPEDVVQLALEAFSRQQGDQERAVSELIKFIDGPPKLIYTAGYPFCEGEMRLSYKVRLKHDDPLKRRTAFIDALNGDVIKIVKNTRELQNLGLTLTGYYGSKEIQITQSDDKTIYYAEQAENRKIAVFNCVEDQQCPVVTNINRLNFGTEKRDEEQLMAAYWGMERIWDLIIQVFDRKGYDNKGSIIEIKGTKLNSSFWTHPESEGEKAQASFGFLTAFDLTTLDIVGHEICHGIVQNEAGLIEQGEPGIIAESICDCFGVYAHATIRGLEDYWIMGSETHLYTRSIKDPKAHKQPDTYLREFWYNGTDDHGGIHQNSGVPSHAYYLLAAGGDGVNDLGNVYNVTGISLEQATLVLYRAITNYLTKNSNLKDYRYAITTAAHDLYGQNAKNQAEAAFYAVGIGDKPASMIIQSQENTLQSEGSYASALESIQIWILSVAIWVLIKEF